MSPFSQGYISSDNRQASIYTETLETEQVSKTKANTRLVHCTFRIGQDVLNALEKESYRKSVSLSNLVNNTLRTHVFSNILFNGKITSVLLSVDFLRTIFDKMNKSSLEDYGRDLGLSLANEYVSYSFPEINSLTLVAFLRLWFDKFRAFEYKVDYNTRRHTFSIYHDININFSVVLKYMLEGLLEPIIKRNIQFGKLTSTTVTFSFES